MSSDVVVVKHSPTALDEDRNSEYGHGSNDSVLSDSNLDSESDLEISFESDRESDGESSEEHVNENRYNVDFETIEDITNILSQIQLVWPENLPAYDREVNRQHPRNLGYPPSYFECTDKEKAALWHAENFRQQFAYLFPKRRPLYLAPRNECGVQKLFPTYIEPTVLGYPEFYDYDTIVEFLKDYLSPEFLDPPDLLPATIRSPLTSLKIRCANIFEFALVATSFLIGAGFDAYVVDGYAVEKITTGNTTGSYVEEDENKPEKIQETKKKETEDELNETESTTDMDIFREEDAIPEVSPSKYKLPDKKEVTSTYLAAMQKRVDDKLAEEKKLADEEAAKEAERNKRPVTPDVYEGYRVHAWILILPGKRGVLKPFFLEPFSGTRKEINDSVFLGIEAVFNNTNYYVNHQDCQGEGIDKLNFNMKDKTKWSKLLYEPPPKKKRGNPLGQESFQDEEEDDTPETVEMFLDMPVSWVSELEITQEEYDLKYPDGKKILNFDDAIVEIASPFVNLDGLVKKVIKFSSKSRKPKDVVYIEEWFMNRKDKLIRRKWVREGRMVYEHFSKGRRDSLKEHSHVAGRNNPDQPRKLYYYSDSHHQNVSLREVIPKGIIEYFDNRDDKLYYRMTQFGKILCFTIPPKEVQESGVRALLELMTTDDTGGAKNRPRRKILKIYEKFHRDPEKDYKEDISEKHMLMEDHLLRVMFHYGEGSITRNTMEFTKNLDDEFTIKESFEYRADPYSKEMDEYTKFKLLKSLLKEETRSSSFAREADDEIYTIVKQRVQEDWRHDIEPDDFSGDRSKQFMQKSQMATAPDGYSEDVTGIDFTTPYIEKHGMPKTKMEEILMKKRIMYHMKKRILRQAETMENAFNHESAHLKSKLDWYNSIKNQMSPTEEEIFHNFYKEALFRMHMIKQRLIRHIERAPSSYYTLMMDVLNHPSLNNFTNKRTLPPQPYTEITDLDKKLMAKELERKQDCCQFFHFRFKEGAQDTTKAQPAPSQRTKFQE